MHTNDLVLNSCTSVGPGVLSAFCAKASPDLTGIRNGILIFLQDPRQSGELESSVRGLNLFSQNAHAAGQDGIAASSQECERVLTDILDHHCPSPEKSACRALDLIARIEASLFKTPLVGNEPLFNISGFLDESFERLTNGSIDQRIDGEPEPEAGFEIDEETLEIFRGEAFELLENISANLQALAATSNDTDALWNIRRCAHTFKGAAGIVGLNEASALAHRVEDLLDQLAENQRGGDDSVFQLLTISAEHLRSMTLGCGSTEQRIKLDKIYAEFDRLVADKIDRRLAYDPNSPKQLPVQMPTEIRHGTAATVKPPPAPIVRVALDRLDELQNLTRNLAVNRSSLARHLTSLNSDNTSEILEKIGPLFEMQRQLTDEIQNKIVRIRMVRFGVLATRLNRAVHVTCQEEGKNVEVFIDNEDLEIDTQILDSLVEPLLHLLRNAVVHGIESPERRRLIGKPEKGQIWIEVASGDGEIIVSVRDDGRGVSTSKLRGKAVASGAIDRASSDTLSDADVHDLMYLRGITTVDHLSLNAGRGVGMSIVKESIGSIGGSISIASEAQQGTTFTIKIPLVAAVLYDPVEAVNRTGENISRNRRAESARRSVLIVDDSSSMRQLITRMIEKAGCTGTLAADALNAIELLSDLENRPDIILTDLEMPNMDGYEFLEYLKTDDALRGIPVVMITSRTGQAHRQKAFDLGVADFISKPFSEELLIETIDLLTLGVVTL